MLKTLLGLFRGKKSKKKLKTAADAEKEVSKSDSLEATPEVVEEPGEDTKLLTIVTDSMKDVQKKAKACEKEIDSRMSRRVQPENQH